MPLVSQLNNDDKNKTNGDWKVGACLCSPLNDLLCYNVSSHQENNKKKKRHFPNSVAFPLSSNNAVNQTPLCARVMQRAPKNYSD